MSTAFFKIKTFTKNEKSYIFQYIKINHTHTFLFNTIKPLLKVEQAPHFNAWKSKLHIFVQHYLYWKFHSTALLMFSFLLETINTFILKILQIERQMDRQAEKDRQIYISIDLMQVFRKKNVWGRYNGGL